MKLVFAFAGIAAVFLTIAGMTIYFSDDGSGLLILICSFTGGAFIRAAYKTWKKERKK